MAQKSEDDILYECNLIFQILGVVTIIWSLVMWSIEELGTCEYPRKMPQTISIKLLFMNSKLIKKPRLASNNIMDSTFLKRNCRQNYFMLRELEHVWNF